MEPYVVMKNWHISIMYRMKFNSKNTYRYIPQYHSGYFWEPSSALNTLWQGNSSSICKLLTSTFHHASHVAHYMYFSFHQLDKTIIEHKVVRKKQQSNATLTTSTLSCLNVISISWIQCETDVYRCTLAGWVCLLSITLIALKLQYN